MRSAALGRYSAALVLAALLAVAPSAAAASLSWSTSSETRHADMPFTLTLSAAGFEEEPAPDAPGLAIDGCDVVFVGMTPSVSSRIEIVNGRRSEWREVTFNYRWRVTAPAEGRYTVPPLRVEQAGVEARSGAAGFEVTAVPDTDDMIVRLRLPDRAVWVGETFDVSVRWLLARDVDSYEFVVPLFDLDGAHVDAPATTGESLRFMAGAKEIQLPLKRDNVRRGGQRYTRFIAPARVTLNNVGTTDLAPIRVVASLQSGTTRDSFGFRRPRYALHRAEGDRQRVTVRPLPQANRPPSFVNAIGEGFAIEVRASRSVVSVGEPIELVIGLRGAPPLTGLSLPPLTGPEALPAAQFSVPEASTAGTVDEDAGVKRFPLTVRVRSAEVREIPPIAFSYFDPQVGEYRTVHSEPIALSVGAGQLVGAADVVAAPVADTAVPERDVGSVDVRSAATLLGAEMAISDPARTYDRPWGSDGVAIWLGALYGVPVLVALVSFGLRRTEGRRARVREVRRALAAVEEALDAGSPARQAAPAIGAAMRKLAVATDADLAEASAALQRLETRAFDPRAADERVDDDAIEQLRIVARQWAAAGGSQRGAVAGAATGLCVALVLALPAEAAAEVDPAAEVDAPARSGAPADVRRAYQAALAETDRLRRIRLFEAVAVTLKPIALVNPSAAELQVDWGNAALGAQDRGQAVLAWRRALRVDPGNERAGRNLRWLRDRLPVWLPRPASAGALDSLLFWRSRLTPTQLHLIGAAGFATATLLLVLWRVRRWPWCRAVAVAAGLVWVAGTMSALSADDQRDDAVVVIDGATLRSADSAGAGPTFPNPLPAGTEVSIIEARDAWLRVMLSDGTRGWLARGVVERVAPRDS